MADLIAAGLLLCAALGFALWIGLAVSLAVVFTGLAIWSYVTKRKAKKGR